MEGLHSIIRVLPYHTQCSNYCEFLQDISFMHSGIKFGVKTDYCQVACRCTAL